jgi:hypothetical protein
MHQLECKPRGHTLDKVRAELNQVTTTICAFSGAIGFFSTNVGAAWTTSSLESRSFAENAHHVPEFDVLVAAHF